MERFNNHPKVKELGLTLTRSIAHHVMLGRVNRNTKKITGCHHLNGPCFCYTITKSKTFGYRVNIASVQCGNCKKDTTSLFPDHWNHSKNIDEILECLDDGDYEIRTKAMATKYIMNTRSNFKIEMQVKNKGVDSYYPQIYDLVISRNKRMYLKIIKENKNLNSKSSLGPMATLDLLLEEWLIFVDFQQFLNDLKNEKLEELSYNNMVIEKITNNNLRIYNSCFSDENEYHLLILIPNLIKITRVYFEFIYVPWTEFLIKFEDDKFNIFVDGALQEPKLESYTPLV